MFQSSKFQNILFRRCELRRIRESQSGERTVFLLRAIEFAKNRRWTGTYYFYNDQDCLHATYGLEMHGVTFHRTPKTQKFTLNITSVKIAIYSAGIKNEITTKYNNSCPGFLTMTSGWRPPVVYTADNRVYSNEECLKALGVDPREFQDAFFETHKPSGTNAMYELLQNSAYLRKLGKPYETFQWPLVSRKSQVCLTCAKTSMARLTHPPKLYTRNATSLDGTWASFRCNRKGLAFYLARIDKFDGNTFESTVYQMDHTGPEKCDSAIFGIYTTGSLRKVGNSIEVPGGVVYQMSIKTAHLTPLTRAITSIFNVGVGSCGLETWEKGKTQDLIPTNGCSVIGYSISVNTPELILMRTVHDENRNELYIGTGNLGQSKKSGPVEYSYILQDCSTFPVQMTTTPGPTETTTVKTQDSSPDDREEVANEEDVVNVIEDVKPTSSATSLDILLGTILACLLLSRQAVRFAWSFHGSFHTTPMPASWPVRVTSHKPSNVDVQLVKLFDDCFTLSSFPWTK